MAHKITILNAFGWSNKGDAGILYAMIYALNKYFGKNTEYYIESWSYRIDQKKYPAIVFPPIWKPPTVFNLNKAGIFYGFLNIFEAPRKFLLSTELSKTNEFKVSRIFLLEDEKELLQNMIESDIILSIGGGFLHDREGGSAFLRHLYSLSIATKLQVPLMIYAQSIGPFYNGLYKKITKNVLNKVNLITTRDYVSKKYLLHIGVENLIKVTADAAFSLPNPWKINSYRKQIYYLINNKYPWIIDNEFNVGITVRDWNLSDTQKEQYISSIQTLVKYVIDKYGGSVTFYPQVLADINLSNEIINHLPDEHRRKCFVITDDLDPLILKGLYGLMDVFVGTRMHSTIFSMSMNVSTISIAYMSKSRDLMYRLGLEKLLLNIDSINRDLLIKKFNYLVDNYEAIKLKLKKQISYMRKLSMLNAKYAYTIAKEEGL